MHTLVCAMTIFVRYDNRDRSFFIRLAASLYLNMGWCQYYSLTTRQWKSFQGSVTMGVSIKGRGLCSCCEGGVGGRGREG